MNMYVIVGVACSVVMAMALTPCQKERLEAASRVNDELGLPFGMFIPNCEEDGTYSPKQCHYSMGMCWCAREDGSKINEPAKGKYKACMCVRQRDAIRKNMRIGAFVPSCQVNGHYNKRQCWGSVGNCWCVNQQTAEKLPEDLNC